jgi:hypothetical protein
MPPALPAPGPGPAPKRRDGSLLGRKVRRNLEPAWDATKKGLAVTGFLALLGGLWLLDHSGDDTSDAWTFNP